MRLAASVESVKRNRKVRIVRHRPREVCSIFFKRRSIVMAVLIALLGG